MNRALRDAIAEMQSLITATFPDATFTVSEGDDPEGIYLLVMVDVDDTDDVVDVYIDRLVDLQLGKKLPLYVIPLRPFSRVVASETPATVSGH